MISMLALGETASAIIVILSLLATAYTLLSQKKPKAVSLDDALQSVATQGAFIPLVIGRTRSGPVFCFVEDDTGGFAQLVPQSRSLIPGLAGVGTRGIFGKGGGGAPQQPAYFERALHVLAIGPGRSLDAIYQNGEVIWSGPITPESHPSGSVLNAGDSSASEGAFEIHWGFPDDPILVDLQNSKFHGLAVRYSHVLKIYWRPKNLGPARQWPRLEYEFSCPCYSQIASSSSETPLEGNDLRPTFEQWIAKAGGNPTAPPTGSVPEDKAQTFIAGVSSPPYTIPTRGIVVEEPENHPNQPDFTRLFVAGGIVKIKMAAPGAAFYPWLTYDNAWHYYWVSRSYRVGTLPATMVVLGREVEDLSLFVVNPQNSPTRAVPVGSPPSEVGWIEAVDTSYSDGINLIHMIDQLLFAKYPYGAGKNRAKFNAKSIEYAAEIMQGEKIRGGIAIKDGEGARSAIAAIQQDIGLFIVWDVNLGQYVFSLIRYEETAVNLQANLIMEIPEVISVQGSRPSDVVAFTFKDRQRNYREVPMKVMDTGQIQEYESQRSKKIPIECTQDRDSVSRLLPRRQQEALANLSAYKFTTNHGTIDACPGQRFTAIETEGQGIQFVLTDVQRYLDSSKVELSALVDSYNSPNLNQNRVAPLVSQNRVLAHSVERPPVAILESFVAVEMPRVLSSGKVPEILVLASRNTEQTASAVVWGSRDGSQYQIVGQCPIVISGVLSEALEENGPINDTGTYDVDFGDNVDPNSIEDLTLDPASWRAGKQVMIIGNEVIFLLDGSVQQPSSTITGLLRGRAGTLAADHPIGTRFYIVPSSYVIPIQSSMLVPGNDFYYRVQAVTKNRVSNLDEIDAVHSIPIDGLAFKPPAVCAVRQTSLSNGYAIGAAAVDLTWGYYSDEFPRTGLGVQPLGAATGISSPRGYFLVSLTGGHILQVSTNSVSIPLALRTTLGLDALPSWQATIVHVEGSFSSDPVSVTLIPA